MAEHSAEEERLLELMRQLTARRGYIDGSERFPRKLDVADARTIAADIHRSVDNGTAKRAELAAEQGHPVACRAGCSACCRQLVMIWAAEAELIAAWLDEPAQEATRLAFLEAYPRWRDDSAAAIKLVLERTAANDAKGQFAALVDHWRKGVMCAFNHDGTCSIYPVRPSLCRHAHALDTSERCVPDETTGSAAMSLQFVPLEQFMKKTKELSMAMHHALGRPRKRSEPLCTAVYQRLRKPARSPG